MGKLLSITSRGISEPLGVMAAVIISIALLLVVVLVSWNFSHKVVEDQKIHSIIVTAGTPYGFYDSSLDKLVKVVIPVYNPTSHVILLKELIIENVEVLLNISIDPGEKVLIEQDVSIYDITIENFISGSYIDGVLVTDAGSVSFPIIVYEVK